MKPAICRLFFYLFFKKLIPALGFILPLRTTHGTGSSFRDRNGKDTASIRARQLGVWGIFFLNQYDFCKPGLPSVILKKGVVTKASPCRFANGGIFYFPADFGANSVCRK
jgi:hypothetical protein